MSKTMPTTGTSPPSAPPRLPAIKARSSLHQGKRQNSPGPDKQAGRQTSPSAKRLIPTTAGPASGIEWPR